MFASSDTEARKRRDGDSNTNRKERGRGGELERVKNDEAGERQKARGGPSSAGWWEGQSEGASRSGVGGGRKGMGGEFVHQ